MNGEMSYFALNQVLTSAIILGPIFLVVGLINRRLKRKSSLYLSVGLFLFMVGCFCLYKNLSESHSGGEAPSEQVLPREQ